MFYPLMSLAIAALFFVLTPGILVTLPAGKGKFVVAATHAAIFALVFHFTHKTLMNLAQQYEGFERLCAKNSTARQFGDQSCCNGKKVAVGGMC